MDYEITIANELEKAALESTLHNLKKLVEDLPKKVPDDYLRRFLPEHREWKKDEWIVDRLSSVLSFVGERGIFEVFAYLLTETKANVQWIWGFERIGWNHIKENEFTQNHLKIAKLVLDSGFGDEEVWIERIKELNERLET